MEGIARAGNGTALFATLEERLETKVMQQLQDALKPSLTGYSIDVKPVFSFSISFIASNNWIR